MRIPILKGNIRRQVKLKEMRMSLAPRGVLRNAISALRRTFFAAPTQPILRRTTIDRDTARSLYYNTNYEILHGGHFTKAIINAVADFMGVPIVSTKDEGTDFLINDLVTNVWKKALWEGYRTSCRDTNCWVRLRKPFPNVLLSVEEENDVFLEVIDADRVTPYYNPYNSEELIRVEVSTMVYVEDLAFNPDVARQYGSGIGTQGQEHEIIEVVTANRFRYYDNTVGVWDDEMEQPNDWNFVPFVEMFNDYDTALQGGVCEIETAYVFMQAFSELTEQLRSAHKYHGNPKLKLNLADTMNFLRNNFPDSFVNGEFSGKVDYHGMEVFFLEGKDEDVGFVQIDTGTSDAVTLLNFLFDCVCIASETPAWVLLRSADTGAKDDQETIRFKKKIERKRSNFAEYIQQVVRMSLKIILNDPKRVTIFWPPVEVSDLADEAQALNQLVTAAEVANRAGVLSRRTYRARVRPFFPAMKSDAEEEKQIASEQSQEQKQQLDFQKQQAQINPPSSTTKPSVRPQIVLHTGNLPGIPGPNSASSRNGHATRLPMDVMPVGD